MKCPKCGYVSFNSNLECPKCKSDLSVEQRKLNLPSFKPSPPSLLGAIVGNESHPVESYRGKSTGAGGDDSTRSIGGTNESIGVDEDIIFGEGVASEATEELKPPSEFPPPPPYFRRQLEEIKELVSELMPKKSKTALDENMDDIVIEHDFSMSRGDKEFAPGDQIPEDGLVEGLENLEGLTTPGKIGEKEDQFEASERATKEVCRKKLEAKEE
jgi:hypothetical protein